ncbi:MAG: hypothetical protein HRU19_18775 [Pseudobacteriovorax sp.]|nr:hypothetical protein [Pseudobacteriovorax sp.]
MVSLQTAAHNRCVRTLQGYRNAALAFPVGSETAVSARLGIIANRSAQQVREDVAGIP